MPIIKKADFAESDLLKEVDKSLKDTEKLVISLTESNKKLAESFDLIKRTNDGAEAKKLTEATDKLKKSTSELTGVQKERIRLSKEREKILAKLITVENKQNEVLEKGKAQLRDKNKLIKANAVLNNKLSGTEEKLLALNVKARLERKKLNTETKKGQVRLKELNAEIDRNNAKIKQNSDKLKQQKIGIGKYSQALKGLGTQLLGKLGITSAFAFLADQFNKASERAVILTKSTNRLQHTFDITRSQARKLANQINAISTNFEDADPKNLEIALTAIVGAFKDITESEALNLIEEGFKKGSNNSGELLDILKEYPGFFKKAGLSANEMFAIINQQVTEGVYSDKGVDAIKEATISLTENTKIVKDALRPLGESVNLQIRQKVEAGKAFEAMQLIAQEMQKLGDNSAEVQTIMADVFKGAGEDSEAFVRNLHNVELSLANVATQTTLNQDVNLELSKSYNKFVGVVGDSEGFLSLFFANLKFNLSEILADFADFFTDTVGLKILRRETDENEKSTRRLTTAEKELIKEEKKAEENRIKWEAGEEARRKKRERESAAELKRIKRESDAEDKAEAKKRAKDLKAGGEPVELLSFNDEIESDKRASLDRLSTMNDDFRKKEANAENEANARRKANAIQSEDAILQIKDAAIGAAGQILADSISFGIDAQVAAFEAANEAEQERNEVQAEADKEILTQKLEDGLITEQEFKDQSAKIDEDLRVKNERLEKETKKQLAIADKKKALFDVGIATAVGVARVIPNPIAMAAAAVLGALQLAVVAARPIPKFEKGEINIDAPRHSQGGMLAEIEGGESYINRQGTANAPIMLNDINNGLFKDSDIEMMKNNDNYSYNMLQLNGLVDELRANGSLTKETNQILSRTVNMNEQGKMLAVRDYKGNIIRYEVIN